MASWQDIWQGDGAKRLWSAPDRQVVEVARSWKSAGTVRHVLDVGCGAGRHTSHLAREGFEVCGWDPSESAIEACRQLLQSQGLRARLWSGELEDLPSPDDFFDAAVAFNCIYHGLPAQIDSAVHRIRRLLRSGGICFATFPSHENRMYGKGQMIGPHTFLSPGLFPRVFDDEGERDVPHHFSSEDEVRWFFRDFRIASFDHDELALARPSLRGQQPAWFRIPKAYFWRVVAIADGDVHRADVQPARAR